MLNLESAEQAVGKQYGHEIGQVVMDYNLQGQTGAPFYLLLPLGDDVSDLQDNLEFYVELYMLVQDSEELQKEILGELEELRTQLLPHPNR